MRLRISNAEFRNLDSVNHCTSKEMPNLDAVNHCTSKTESRFGISKFGIPIEIRRYRTRLGDLKNKQSTESLMSDFISPERMRGGGVRFFHTGVRRRK